MKHLAPLVLLSLISACSSAPKTSTLSAQTALTGSAPNPTAVLHALRSRQVANSSYQLWLNLDANHKDFEGRLTLQFDLKAKAAEHAKRLALDFSSGSIKSILLNGAAVDGTEDNFKSRYDGTHILFALSELQAGMNKVQITYTQAYRQLSKDGTPVSGLIRKGNDDSTLIYAQPQPTGCAAIFPCFDQPDLRGSLELTVETPPEWTVIANMNEREISKVDGRRSWVFPPSPLLSPSRMALAAGTLHLYKAEHEGIPVRIITQEKLKTTPTNDWLPYFSKAIDFYNAQFSYPYPYSKIDILLLEGQAHTQVYAGLFIAGLPAANALKTKLQQRQHMHAAYRALAEVWIGCLATSKNLTVEPFFSSLNDFLAWEALEEDTTFGTSAKVAFSAAKQAAFATGTPFFPAQMRHLVHLIGEDEFWDGTQRFVQKNVLKTMTAQEYFKYLSEAAGTDLSKWAKGWIAWSRPSTLRSEWRCALDEETGKARMAEIALLQAAPELRPARTEVAFYFGKSVNAPLTMDTLSVPLTGKDKQPLVSPVGKACPLIVLPTYQDFTAATWTLDAISQQNALELMNQGSRWANFIDAHSRLLIWQALLEGSTRNEPVGVALAPRALWDLALKQLKSENDPDVFAHVFLRLHPKLSGQASLWNKLRPTIAPTSQAPTPAPSQTPDDDDRSALEALLKQRIRSGSADFRQACEELHKLLP